MMLIGAKTPAMIKAMTTEVESKNFIVASKDLMSALSDAVPACPAFAPSRLIEPLHAPAHDWQRSSSRIGTSNRKK